MADPALEQLKPDRDAFRANLPELLKHHAGKFALIKSGEVVDVCDSMDAAYAVGMKRFGLERFYIGHVVESETPESLPALTLGLIRAVV